MSWEDQTEIVRTVLARVDPASPQLFAGAPELDRLFGGPSRLPQALDYRWKIHLDVKSDHALHRGRSTVDAYLELAIEAVAR
ncbi:hypothetical protein ACWDYH_09885 [Nocardia goodfellowii]